MLDGQGCLLPVRHFHSEDSSLMLSSVPGRYRTCRAEASAESSPNSSTNPHAHHSQSTDACPCSLVGDEEQESNVGDFLDLKLSRSCHCPPAPFAEADAIQAWDSISAISEEGGVSSISSDFNCSSSTPSRSAPALPSSPAQEAEAVPRNSDGKLEGVDTSHCMLAEADSRSSDPSRSEQEEGSSGKVLDGNKIDMEFAEAALSSVIRKDEGCRRSVGDGREGVEYSDMLQKVSRDIDNEDQLLGSVCVSNNCMNSKETEEGCSETANAEKILTKHSSFKLLDRQCGSSHSPGAKGCKKLRLTKCSETSHDTLLRGTSISAKGKMACSSVDDHTSEQQPYLPGLDNESALRCLAFVPLCDLGRLSLVGRQYRDLVKSRLIFEIRRTYGMVEHLVFIYTSGPGGWTAYDANRNVWKTLPPANVGPAFIESDKESLSAGTHVLWLGKVMFEFVYYRYDLLTNSWERGPSMINPRCLFASASCGEFAYVAGGFGSTNNSGALTLLNSAEKYNSLTGQWERLPPMSTPRHKCSGFFMDGNFYVIGGRDANHQPIMSGEEYNPRTGVWRTIPNMYFAPEIRRRDMVDPSPPLVAVVNNQLYAVENTTNALKIYNKQNNTWTKLGYLPVPADFRNGWGVAFKALGDRLFVMGDLEGIAACCWRPGPNASEPVWQLLSHRERGVNSFLYNCAVMNC